MLSIKDTYTRLAPIFSALPPLENVASQRLMFDRFLENEREDQQMRAALKASAVKSKLSSEKIEIGVKDDSSDASEGLQEASRTGRKDLSRRNRNKEALRCAQQAQVKKMAAINAALKGDSTGLDEIREKEFHNANLRAMGHTVRDDVKRLKKTVQQDRRGRSRGGKKSSSSQQKQKAGFSRRRAPLN